MNKNTKNGQSYSANARDSISNGVKVAIVHDFLHSLGGAERVLLALTEIFPEAPVYTLLADPKIKKFFPNKKIHTSYLQKWSFIPSRFFISFFPRAIESFDFSDFDVVISSSNSFAKNIITKPETIHISYIHSPMRYAWDETHTQLANQAHRTLIGRAFGLTEWVASNIIHRLRIWDKLGSSRVDVFVANSENVRNRIKKYYRRDAQVIYPPADTHLIKPNETNEGYYLVISRLSKYKRIELAVEACQELGLPLVVIGNGEMENELKKMATQTTKFLGFVDDATKIKYLENCKALLFPGEEDLGIVPIEAMAAGKPVLAFKKGGLLETVIDGVTGAFFLEQTTASITQALRNFDRELSKYNVEEIRKHAQKFSKQTFKDNIDKLVHDKINARE
jgi:glycosyltransferase involved in cell wall biosynthesis